MNTGLTSLFCVCVFKSTQTSYPKSMSQRNSNEEKPGIHAQAVSANADTFEFTHRKKIQ